MDAYWATTYALLFGVTIVHHGISLSWFLGRRSRHPLCGHSVPLITVCLAANATSALAISATSMGVHMPCWLWLTLVYNATTISTACYTTHALRMYSLDATQARRGATNVMSLDRIRGGGGESKSSLGPRSWSRDKSTHLRQQGSRLFARRRSDRSWLVCAGGVALATVGGQDAVYLARGGTAEGSSFTYDDPEPCAALQPATIVFTCLLGFSAILGIVGLCALRKLSNTAVSKTECIRAWVWLVAVAAFFGGLPGAAHKRRDALLFAVWALNTATLAASTWRVWTSYRLEAVLGVAPASRAQASLLRSMTAAQTADHVVERTRTYTLEEVFEDYYACEKFKLFLQREWSVENLMFYQATQQFAALCGDGALDTAALRSMAAAAIVDTFVRDESPSMINLPSEIRDQLLAATQSPGPESESEPESASVEAEPSIASSVFEASRQEIFHLMQRDSFVRFTTAYSYEELFPHRGRASFSTCV